MVRLARNCLSQTKFDSKSDPQSNDTMAMHVNNTRHFCPFFVKLITMIQKTDCKGYQSLPA